MAIAETESLQTPEPPNAWLRAAAACLSLYALYWVVAVVPAAPYRASFLLAALLLIAFVYRAGRGNWSGLALAAGASLSLGKFLLQVE